MNKTKLFLLPGLMCDNTAWEHQITHLSDIADISVPDFRGYDSLTKMAESVLLQAPEGFNLAGHSMGGRVALELIRLAPDKILKLALLDTGAHPLAEGERKTRQSYIDIARAEGMNAVADKWLTPMIHPDRINDTELLNAIRTMVTRTSVEDFIKQIHALINRPDAYGYLADIKCKTVLLVGSDDTWSPVKQHEDILSYIPHASLKIIKDAGHMVTMERPEQVTRALREWLTDQA